MVVLMHAGDALRHALSALAHLQGLSGAHAPSRALVTLKIGLIKRAFPPASHVALCDTQSAVAVTARRKQ
jgi:hypothetical protein